MTTTTIGKQFNELEAEIKRRIEDALTKKEWSEIERLTRLGKLCGQGKDLESSIVAELNSTNGISNANHASTSSSVSMRHGGGIASVKIQAGKPISAKGKGKQLRQKWLSELSAKGIQLNQSRGNTVFLSRTGRKVGIPTATESQPDKWFLGLPDEQFDAVVLLCEDQSGRVLDFILPHAGFLDSIWSVLSRSGGQVKLNVLRGGANIYLIVPGGGRPPIDLYHSNYSCLR